MITRVNNNRGRRFLNPLEVEAQYHTEDRTTNPDLLLWIDFTDNTSLLNSSSAQVSHNEKIEIAMNKSHLITTSNAGTVSAGEKALCQFIIQATSSKQ